MSLKTSLFDKSTVKTDLRRFWWVSTLYLLACAITFLPIAVGTDCYENNKIVYYYNSDNGGFAFIAAFFIAGILFAYLNKANSVSCLHGLPVTRGKQYRSHILSGMLLILVPVIICGGIIAAECIYLTGSGYFAVKFVYTSCVYAMLAFFITTVAAMLSGNTIAAYIFSAGFMILPAYIITMCEVVCGKYLYGYYGSRIIDTIEKIYLMGIDNVWTLTSVWYIVLIAVLAVLGYIIYCKRPLENYDEIVTFKWLRPVFMYVVAICFGFFGYSILYDLTDCEEIFIGMLPLGIAAIIATNMLIHKSFNLKGAFKHIVIYVVLVGAFRMALVCDITGFEHRVPDVDSVESIEFSEDNRQYYFDSAVKGIPSYSEVSPTERFTSTEDIASMIALHKAVVSDGRDAILVGKKNYNVYIKYHLKNGGTLTREYSCIDVYKYADYLKPVFESDKYKKEMYPILRHGDDLRITGASYYDSLNARGGSVQLYEYNIDYGKLLEAIRADLKAMTYEQMLYTFSCETGHSLELNMVATIGGNNYSGYSSIGLNKYFTHTRELLAAVDESAYIMLVEDSISGGTLNISNEDGSVNNINIDKKTAVKIAGELNDMDYIDSTDGNDKQFCYVGLDLQLGDGDSFSIYVNKPLNELPKEVKRYT